MICQRQVVKMAGAVVSQPILALSRPSVSRPSVCRPSGQTPLRAVAQQQQPRKQASTKVHRSALHWRRTAFNQTVLALASAIISDPALPPNFRGGVGACGPRSSTAEHPRHVRCGNCTYLPQHHMYIRRCNVQAVLAGVVAGGSALSLAIAPAALAAQEAFMVAEVGLRATNCIRS